MSRFRIFRPAPVVPRGSGSWPAVTSRSPRSPPQTQTSPGARTLTSPPSHRFHTEHFSWFTLRQMFLPHSEHWPVPDCSSSDPNDNRSSATVYILTCELLSPHLSQTGEHCSRCSDSYFAQREIPSVAWWHVLFLEGNCYVIWVKVGQTLGWLLICHTSKTCRNMQHVSASF